jgi:uncharacterized transporter YbjL
MVGLQSGQQAVSTVMEQGLTLFMLGVLVTIIPLLIAICLASMCCVTTTWPCSRARCRAHAVPTHFGEVLDKAGNSIPTTPFAITYALANVFLTLLGPLVIAFA